MRSRSPNHRALAQSLLARAALLCLCTALSATAAVQAPVDHVIAKNQLITEELVVPVGGSLTIHAGVALRFAPEAGILCSGTLIAEGTAAHPILLGDTEAHGWRGIAVLAAGTVRLRRCRLSGASGHRCWLDPASGVLSAAGAPPAGVASTLTAGGALLIIGGGVVRCERSRFDHDHADYGGAVACLGASTPTFTACRFDDDHATQDGGALYWSAAAAGTIAGCLIDANTAAVGGGLRLVRGAAPSLTACRIEHDAATGLGGAIAMAWSAHPRITDCLFVHDRAGTHGASLSSVLDSTPTLAGNWFEDNADQDGAGPGLQTSSMTEGKVDHSTCNQDGAVSRERLAERLAHAGTDTLEELLPDP